MDVSSAGAVCREMKGCRIAKPDPQPAADEVLAIIVPLDSLYWTKRAANAAEALAQLKSSEYAVRRVELWVSGRFTSGAKREIESCGVVVREHARDLLEPASFPMRTGEPT